MKGYFKKKEDGKVYYYPRVQNSQRNKRIRRQGPMWYIHLNPRPFRPNGRVEDKPSSCYKQSVYDYFMKSLAESSIMGVNRIASSGKYNLWILVLVLCVGGFLFQSLEFWEVYRSKPSVIEIHVENNGLADFPAFTVCGRNRFRKSVFCRYMPEECELISLGNRSSANSLIEDVIYDHLTERNSEKLRELGYSSDLVRSCHFNGHPEVQQEECQQMLERSYDPQYGNCYTIPPKNLKGQVLQSREADLWNLTNELTLLLDMKIDDILEVQKPTALLANVHDDLMWPDIDNDGKMILPGNFYSFALRKTSLHLLPSPYKSNCTSMSKLPWQKNFKRRLTPKRCTISCSQHHQLKKCNFVTKILSTYYDILPYDPKKMTEADRICAEKEEERTQDYCRTICGLPCSVRDFDMAMSTQRLTRTHMDGISIHTASNRTWKETMKNVALIKIYFATMEHKIFKYIPRYDTMELVSYLGSYSGMWLGFSLLTVYEMVDIILSTCLFAYQKQQKTAQCRKLFKVTSRSQMHKTKK